jgi:hypothetical protein
MRLGAALSRVSFSRMDIPDLCLPIWLGAGAVGFGKEHPGGRQGWYSFPSLSFARVLTLPFPTPGVGGGWPLCLLPPPKNRLPDAYFSSGLAWGVS